MTTSNKTRIIQLAGYTNSNTATLWFDGKVYTCTSFVAQDYDYGDQAEQALDECKAFIKHKEQSEGWIAGNVTCWISEDEIELEEAD